MEAEGSEPTLNGRAQIQGRCDRDVQVFHGVETYDVFKQATKYRVRS